MRERACNNCGGKNYEVVGQNMVKCLFCGTLYVDEQASKDEEFLIARAYDFLRELQFEKALDEFNKTLSLFPMSFEAFFGRALAKNKIVIYPNKRGVLKSPCFFGEKIVSLLEDEDAKKAISIAPPERAKMLVDISKRTEKIKKGYEAGAQKKIFDCILSIFCKDEEKKTQFQNEILKMLNANELSVFNCDDLLQKESEEISFRALETAKVFVCCYLDESPLGRFKNLFDRYFHLITLRKKTASSFVLCTEKSKLAESLPKEFFEAKNVMDTTSISFSKDLEVRIVNEIENAKTELAKIDTIRVEKARPKKKEYLDLESISPVDLGHYEVQNVPSSSDSKKKWIFLALKNKDFQTAKELVEKELEDEPYSSDLLFAKLLAEKKICSEEEFFSKISNFSDKDQIENILRYANKSFGENFVDRWEMLIQELDDVEFYNQYLTFLASFKTPNRENFVSAAENKAVETNDQQLIENVESCFGRDVVDRFERFYFLLAQKNDDKKYYQKILEIDSGHAQSNIALMLRHFETPKDKLSYRNREEIENMLQFLDEKARIAFVSAVVDLILPVAFFNLEEAEKQLDFYLAYIQDNSALVSLLKKIADALQQMQFFKMAEKYVSIAISKAEANAELYWKLIQIKCHCRSDEEVIASKVKPSDFPEWETLLEIGDDAHDELYGAIVSKNNLFSGTKTNFQPDLLDKEKLKSKLKNFLLRNEKILLDIEKQDAAKIGLDYFKSQLKPFEKYLAKIDSVQTFEDFQTLYDKIQERLLLLGLSLDSSISVLQVEEKAGGFSRTEEKQSFVEKKREQQFESLRKKQFLKRFLIIFLEFIPLCFSLMLFALSIFMPKEVYPYFSQTFLIISVAYAAAAAAGNLIYFLIKKKRLSRGKIATFLTLFVLGVLNALLLAITFFVLPPTIKITTQNDLLLMQNAQYANFSLGNDLDFSQKKWTAADFHGKFDGKDHKISNLSDAFLRANHGTVKNLTVEGNIKPTKAKTFGVFVCENFGSIENCVALGELEIEKAEIVSGFAGKNAGVLMLCESEVKIVITNSSDVVAGGLVGENGGEVSKSAFKGTLDAKDVSRATIGGLIGEDKEKSKTEESFSNSQILVERASSVTIGGLVGNGQSSSHDNYASGSITTNEVQGGAIGGLYGSFPSLRKSIEFSYSTVQIHTSLKYGVLVGTLFGEMNSCFSTEQGDLCANGISSRMQNCGQSQKYDSKFNFSETIWDTTSNLPMLLWEKI